MAASGADMMFVAFSSPKKEYWVHKYLNQLNIPFVMGWEVVLTLLPAKQNVLLFGCKR